MKSEQEHYEILISYLRMKVSQEDWHGVADAAMDLRELVAKFPSLKESGEGE